MRRWLWVSLLLISATAWADGHVYLMRHALAPGVGDPPGFKLGDCKTQRDLSAAGLAQARAIGQRLRAMGLGAAPVYTSQWCRSRHTAEALALGEVVELPLLNSFFGGRGIGAEQTTKLQQFLRAQRDLAPLVLVTHQVNITAFADVFPTSGEVLVLELNPAGQWQVVERLAPPQP